MLEQLVAIPSEPGNVAAKQQCVDFVRTYLHGTRWTLVDLCAPGDRRSPVLYVTSHAAGTWHSRLLLLVHLDVVPHDAGYRLTDGDAPGMVRGRGVSDMKGPAVALLHWLRHTDPTTVDAAMLVVTDEESGGLDGARFAFCDPSGPHITCDVCHCPDGVLRHLRRSCSAAAVDSHSARCWWWRWWPSARPVYTDAGGDDFRLVTHEKGVLRARLITTGVPAHSAYPWLGHNAILQLYADISNLLQTVLERTRLFDNSGPGQWYTTMQPTMMRGGDAPNQVPGTAECVIDVRFTEDWTAEVLKAVVQQCVSKSTRVEFIFEQPMLLCPPASPYMQEAQRVMERHLGSPVQFTRGHGTSDGHWASFPVVMFKPSGGGLHQRDEWLDFPSLLTYHAIAAELMSRWASPQHAQPVA